MPRGKFVVLYGINNIGKSTQAKMLVERLKKEGLPVQFFKYPRYDIEPTGGRINSILREGMEGNISEIDLQQLYAQNRRDSEPVLHIFLNRGYNIVSEDYSGTGIAWGWTKGADLDKLEEMNQGLTKEDIAILLDGERFLEGKEKDHIHERENDLVVRCREKHLELGEKYGWIKVDANRPKEDVHASIWEIVLPILSF